MEFDKEILYLPSLYKKFENKCQIICYHGTDDHLISSEEKIQLKKSIKCFSYNQIADKDIDNVVFKPTEHGLEADFLKLYDYTMEKHKFKKTLRKNNENVIYKTEKNQYLVDYSKVVPILYIEDRD